MILVARYIGVHNGQQNKGRVYLLVSENKGRDLIAKGIESKFFPEARAQARNTVRLNGDYFVCFRSGFWEVNSKNAKAEKLLSQERQGAGIDIRGEA